jgi:myo-inositol-1(or 4)-monophosphatase
MTEEPIPLQVAIAAIQAAGRLLRQGYGRAREVSHKGLVDLVTEWDRRSEETILRTIREAFPTHAILAEESGASRQASSHRWIVDPLDGTTNFAHAYPMFGVSIAYERDGELTAGVVLDPLHRELFAAERGRGATLNGRPIHVSAATSLIESLLETGFPYDRRRMGIALAQLDHLAFQAQGIRRAGAAALALAYVAAGRLDGFWEATLNPWDHAAGVLLIREAGGVATQLDGSPYEVNCRNVAASNGRIQGELLDELRRIQASESRIQKS